MRARQFRIGIYGLNAMGLFQPDLYRNFALGFGLGAVIMSVEIFGRISGLLS